MRVFWNVLLFLVPFAVFFAYAYFANKRRAVRGNDPLRTPWYWLIVAGLTLGIAGFFVMRSGEGPGGCYVRAHVDANGKVINGYISQDPNDPACGK